MKRIKYLMLLLALLGTGMAYAWPGMPMPKLHVEGRWLMDEDGNRVNLHGFGQTYSPWFNEMGSKWSNYDVKACLKYNKDILDGVMDRAGWKMTYLRLHMDPYWSNTPGVPTTGENDISAFDIRRFQQYLKEVFIPMAEYAISKGLYVVMRPPGVCPEEIAVGDAYHKYLKRVWGYVSTQKALTDNPYIMFELANEPVRIKGTDGQYGAGSDPCNEALTQFFQEIVDLMRNNGCENILWVPGTGYQSQYAGFAKYPIKGDNIGYAVHVYPGWYGSDAIEPSHELGGSYGGGYASFASGWANQIEPCAEIAPILVTEMDWLPKKYEASWGKSITGKMLGAGFGANFKLLADRTENVSWMIFTGPEILAKFTPTPGTADNYTMYNDPEGCIWSAYHWYEEYGGFDLPEAKSVDLYLSPRSESVPSECLVQTGSVTGAALIADRGLGFDFNVQGDIEVEMSVPGVVEWERGAFNACKIGETDCTISYEINGAQQRKEIHFVSTPFPLKNGYFNPSIWETGSFNEATGEFSTGTYGFAGWKFANGLDLSDYNYLIADIDAPQNNGLSLRLFDIDNYWTDCVISEFDGSTRAVIDLKNMRSKDKGRKLDPSHIYIAGFWSRGGEKFKLKAIFPANDPNSEAGIEDVMATEALTVDVYNMQGVCLRKGVERDGATAGLPTGIYIVGGKKVIVKE